MASSQELFDELALYTLAQPRTYFIHQLAVDAFSAQRADETSRPMAVFFSLAGLCLHLEHGNSGLQVQKVHMQLARERKKWPALPLPRTRGDIEVSDVLAAPPGPARDAAIDAWSRSVWEAWHGSQQAVRDRLKAELGIG